jgi:hypothetical protein
MVGLGLAKILHWNIRTRLRIVDTARGAVAFLLFLLPKPSVEAEQRQQVVPRATRSTVGFQLLDSQGTMARHQRTVYAASRAALSVATAPVSFEETSGVSGPTSLTNPASQKACRSALNRTFRYSGVFLRSSCSTSSHVVRRKLNGRRLVVGRKGAVMNPNEQMPGPQNQGGPQGGQQKRGQGGQQLR